MKQLNIRLPLDLYRALVFIADSKGESFSRFFEREARAIVRRYAEEASAEAGKQAQEAAYYERLFDLVASGMDLEVAAKNLDRTDTNEEALREVS